MSKNKKLLVKDEKSQNTLQTLQSYTDMFPKRHEAGCDVFYWHGKLSCTRKQSKRLRSIVTKLTRTHTDVIKLSSEK